MVSESAYDRPTEVDAATGDQAARTSHDGTASSQPTATRVTARLPPEEFALEETLTTIPDLTVAGASVATAGVTDPLPLVWFQTADTEALAAALDSDPTVTAAEALVHADERHLYRMDWDRDLRWLCHLLLTSEGILLDAQASERHWQVELLYPGREALREVDNGCTQFNLSLEIDAIRTVAPEQTTQYGLTPDQYEALTVACQMGYFTVPREVALEEVADEVGISHQALSERLRRGHETLIATVLGGKAPTLAGSSITE